MTVFHITGRLKLSCTIPCEDSVKTQMTGRVCSLRTANRVAHCKPRPCHRRGRKMRVYDDAVPWLNVRSTTFIPVGRGSDPRFWLASGFLSGLASGLPRAGVWASAGVHARDARGLPFVCPRPRPLPTSRFRPAVRLCREAGCENPGRSGILRVCDEGLVLLIPGSVCCIPDFGLSDFTSDPQVFFAAAGFVCGGQAALDRFVEWPGPQPASRSLIHDCISCIDF